jgi:hypothetical protein
MRELLSHMDWWGGPHGGYTVAHMAPAMVSIAYDLACKACAKPL